jgi:tetratricopeptide (TPR) repeat protein
LNPDYEYGYATRCDTRRELNDFDGATADCKRATELDPTDGYAFDRFGRLDIDMERYTDAVGHFTSAITDDSARASSFAGRCEAYVDLYKYDLAIDDCQKALDINPDNDNGLFYLATAEHNVGRTSDAVRHWNTYITRNPDESVPYYNRGLALIDANQLQAALKDFSTYIGRKPRDGDGFYKRAVVENKLGNKTAALADLKTALHLYQVAGDDAGAKKASDLIGQINGA